METDKAKRIDLGNQAAKIIWENVHLLPLYQRPELKAVEVQARQLRRLRVLRQVIPLGERGLREVVTSNQLPEQGSVVIHRPLLLSWDPRASAISKCTGDRGGLEVMIDR